MLKKSEQMLTVRDREKLKGERCPQYGWKQAGVEGWDNYAGLMPKKLPGLAVTLNLAAQ